jgi:peroxiredoxin
MGKVEEEVKGAPAFTLPDLNGKMVTLAEKKGKVILLNFWATWCPPCRKEMPSMEMLHKKYGGDKFEILAIATDRQGAKLVKPFIDEKGLTFTVLIDSEGHVQSLYDAYALPMTYIIGKDGLIFEKIIGMVDWYSEESQKYIEELIKE